MKKKKLIRLVEDWGKNKGLICHENQYKQFTKFMEEFCEMKVAQEYKVIEDLADGIGDTVVTLIILSKQLNLPFDRIWKIGIRLNNNVSPCPFDVIGNLSASIFRKEMDQCFWALSGIMAHLHEVADENDVIVKECLEIAYKEIKDRTGQTINGKFIKDEQKPPVYIPPSCD